MDELVRFHIFTFSIANISSLALQGSCPPVGEDFGNTDRLFWEPLKIGDIKWNFEKFLVGPEGKPVMRWHPSVNVSTVRTDIRNFLLKLYTQDLFN